MNLLTTAISSNQTTLNQLGEILLVINQYQPSLYTRIELVAGNATIGKHVRHILDFYQRLFVGLSDKSIDYDQRQRDPSLENETDSAIKQIQTIDQQLQQLSQQTQLQSQTPLTVSSSTMPEINTMSGGSTLLRELLFLHSHSTHHMAIISIILRLNQINPGADFGKAPSTISYEQRRSSKQQTANELPQPCVQ